MQPSTSRFWENVDKTDTCWLWCGYRFSTGYGGVWNQARRQYVGAHRVAWELARGPLPPGIFVCHHCDVRNCVRPDHLFLGTARENMADMYAKGRQPSPADIAKGGASRRGARNGRAKLDAAAVTAIRERYAAGSVTQSALAREYGVGQPHISRIIRQAAWDDS